MRYSPSRQRHSALIFVLKGLIPYSRENMLLAFKPNAFFNELEKTSGYSRQTLSATYYRARKQGYITPKLSPRLTKLGRQKVRPFVARKLQGGGKLMVIFDIPSRQGHLRQQFRNLLKQWGFVQIQKSVWMTSYDHRKSVKMAVDELGLADCVQLYEAANI